MLIASAICICCLSLLFFTPPLLTYCDAKIYDFLVAGVPIRAPTNNTIIVDIDEQSLSSLGRWPWPRNLIAKLVEKLHNTSAAVIALDITFPEPDRTAAADHQLAGALAATNSVIGFDFAFNATRGASRACDTPPKPLFPSLAPTSLPRADAILCDTPAISSAAKNSGFLNAIQDSDGLTRRAPLLIRYRHQIYPSLALAAATANSSDAKVLVQQSDGLFLQWQHQRIPIDSSASLLLRYRGRGHTMPYHSAASVLNGLVDPQTFAHKILIVGSSAEGIQPPVRTPLDPDFPSIELQATAVDNLIAGDYFYSPLWGRLVQVLGILVVALASVWLLHRRSLRMASGLALLLTGVIWFAFQTLLRTTGAFISPILISGTCLGTLAVAASGAIWSQRKMGHLSQAELLIANRFITSALAAMTSVRDAETGTHALRIQSYLRSLCNAVAVRPSFYNYLTPQMIDLIVQLAPIHDIGKVGVPDYILRKPAALTEAEFDQMKSHVTLGRKILEDARQMSGLRNELFFNTACDIVYTHHERWDGSGYPLGLKGHAIPICGRLLAVADVYDALISKRHYKKELLHAEAVELIRSGSGRHFDPEIVDAFLKIQADWHQMAEAYNDDPGRAASAK